MVDPEASVSQFIRTDGSWKLEEWRKFLPNWVIEHIQMVKAQIGRDRDKLCWRVASDGNFSISSTYDLIQGCGIQNSPSQGHNLWKWPIPERANFFLWQVYHERVSTNNMRARRGVCESNEFPFGYSCEETLIHTLRDCEIAKGVWMSLINPIFYSTFFNCNLQDWLAWNEKNELGTLKLKGWPWVQVFGTICWNIWKNRCRVAFEEESVGVQSLIHRCRYQLMEEVQNGRFKHKLFNVNPKTNLRWQPPQPGYVRVDVDGSRDRNGQASCGGLIRDCKGN